MTDDMRKCWHCGEMTPIRIRFCEHCGTDRWSATRRADASELREERILLAQTTAVGVWLMATVILLMFWFGGAMLGMAVLWPEGSRWRMVFDTERVLIAAAAAGGLTIASWFVGYRIAGTRIDKPE